MATAFLFTPGDGRPTANAFWWKDHEAIIPKIEELLAVNGYQISWLHDRRMVVSSDTQAVQAGRVLVQTVKPGDVLVPITTGWCWPPHAGIIFTMAQDEIRVGNLRVLNVCNMKEKAPGYVGQRANVLMLETLQVPYQCLTILSQDAVGWAEFGTNLGLALKGEYHPKVPKTDVTFTEEHTRIANEAISMIRKSGCVARLINVSSMGMVQGWPNVHQFVRLGIFPVFVGSNEFQAEMAKIRQKDVDAAYAWLKEHGLNFEYRPHGLSRREIDLALRMYLVKLAWYKQGVACFGTQGQMEQISVVATDLADSLMTSTFSPGKQEPVIDVTEADCEGLASSVLAEAIIKIKFGEKLPVGFHDIRHYCGREDTLVLLNSGALALDFMTSVPGDYSDIWAVSQDRRVYFLQGGACIYGNMCASNNNTLFRLYAQGGTYAMKAARTNILLLTWAQREEIYGKLDRWPMGLAQMSNGATMGTTLNWIPNHGHHVAKDILPELAAACKILGYEFHCFAQ